MRSSSPPSAAAMADARSTAAERIGGTAAAVLEDRIRDW
jgi:hypothetical protein